MVCSDTYFPHATVAWGARYSRIAIPRSTAPFDAILHLDPGATFGNGVRVTTACRAERKVCENSFRERTDRRSVRDSIEWRFVLHGCPICNNLPMCGRDKLSRRKQIIEALQQRRRSESRGR
jgi:hypothetical protein